MKKNTNTRLINDKELPGFCLEHHFGLGSIFLKEGMENQIATCDLFVRDLPQHRNFLVAGGLEAVIDFVKNLKYEKELIKHLFNAGKISDKFAKYLEKFKFSGDIYAMPEGTVHFPGEPIARITAPIIETNIITDQLIALANIDTLLLTKLARLKIAAGDKKCSIGFVRAHGIDAGWRAARNCLYFDRMGFNNVSISIRLGLDATAGAFNANHAFIKSFKTELEAMRAAARSFPDAISPMIDTYNIEQGIKNVIILGNELKKIGKHLDSVVVDSGDLLENAKHVRIKLDEAGHKETKIVVASNLDEYKIKKFIDADIPVDMFLVVTEVVTSADAPKIEMVYKLSQIEDGGVIRYTAKFSSEKMSLPCKKQVFRKIKNGIIEKDIIGIDDENLGDPLLVPIFKKGKLVYKSPTIQESREYVKNQLSSLSDNLKELFNDYKSPVEISEKIKNIFKEVKNEHL